MVSLQCGRGSETLCDLQHRSRIRLCRTLQPVQLAEGVGAPLPADIPGSAQWLPQRQARLPCPCTDALTLQISRVGKDMALQHFFPMVLIRLRWGHSFYVDCLFCTSDSVNVKWRGRAIAGPDLGINEGPRVSEVSCAAALLKLEADTGFMGFCFVVRHLEQNS